MNSLLEYLPPAEGLLPKWIFFISIVSLGNSIQAYLSLGPTQKVYCGSKTVPAGVPASTVPNASPVTPLSARTFGTWTAITAIVRLYAAYNINTKPMYELAFWTYIVAFTHFMSEWLVFGSTRWGKGLAGPAIVATTSLIWMYTQWDYYVKP
ncbi:unnamed protein product [Aureobasidium vineae]|uniref:Ergosterol 28 n=1 Tax=Aureobasidium vineae TaxID=2773715 RepID=A0A9N8JYJ4_9PEZI|nr:unnamed protein product [Aureobasidium vineae]